MGALTGKVAIVTGASRGIGKGIALVLAEQGATPAAALAGGVRAAFVVGAVWHRLSRRSRAMSGAFAAAATTACAAAYVLLGDVPASEVARAVPGEVVFRRWRCSARGAWWSPPAEVSSSSPTRWRGRRRNSTAGPPSP